MGHKHKRSSSSSSSHRKHHKKCEVKCDQPTVIESTPYIITKSGSYCVTADFPVSSSAITVYASNVTLDLANHTFTLNSDTANGIIVDSVSRVVIQNGLIISATRSTETTNIGVNVINSTDVELVNMMIKETGYGVYINGSTDVTMTDLNIYNCGVGEVRSLDSTGIVLEDSQVENVVNDLAVAGIRYDRTDNVIIRNTRLHNADIFAPTGNGLLVDGVNSITDDITYFYGLFQYGTNTPVGTDANIRGFNNGVVRNSTFANINSLDAGPAAVFAVAGDNWQFDNCTFECNRQAYDDQIETCTFFVGGNPAFPNLSGTATDTESYVTNLRVTNCNIQGVSYWAVLVASNLANNSYNFNVVFENCNISNSYVGVELYEDSDTVVQNCKIIYNDTGVILTNNSTYNAFLQNTISDNFIGVQIDAGSNYNLIKENNIFYNPTNNIVDNGTGTQLVNNTVF